MGSNLLFNPALKPRQLGNRGPQTITEPAAKMCPKSQRERAGTSFHTPAPAAYLSTVAATEVMKAPWGGKEGTGGRSEANLSRLVDGNWVGGSDANEAQNQSSATPSQLLPAPTLNHHSQPEVLGGG